MKRNTVILLMFMLGPLATRAQFGRPGGMGSPSPGLSASTAKLFGDNSAFSANLEIQAKMPDSGGIATMPGKMFFDQGKSRFEMDMSEMKGNRVPPNAIAQMKAMGMDKLVMITRPDKKASYMIYPGLEAYAETPMDEKEAAAAPSEFKIETTELGKETIDGHDCIKNKAVVTDPEGTKHESTVWNATDLKKFPIKIETTEQGTTSTMVYKEVNLAKPDAKLFDPPAGYTKYDNVMTMMQQGMMKRMGGAPGAPGGSPSPRPPGGQ